MVRHTNVLGPGNRSAIWLQGCNRRCIGCMSPSTQRLDGGKLVPVEQLLKEILSISGIEGITISGGEPFLQIEALYELLSTLKMQSSLSVIIYTGFTIEELHSMNNSKVESILAKFTDVLIDGEYIEELNDGVALRGSSNQKVYFLTDRYREHKSLYESTSRNAEVIVSKNELFFIGIPEKQTLNEWCNVTSTLSQNNRKGEVI